MFTVPFIKEILIERISQLSAGLIELVIRNKREAYLPDIARNYKALYKQDKGIITASLVTATPVDEKAKQKMEALIRKTFKAEIDLTSSEDEQVIGGFVLTVEDQRYDASVATNLKNIKKELLKTTVVKR